RKVAPSPPSRLEVQVVLRISTSISPEARAVNRCWAVRSTYSTLVGSSKIAAASALQKSMSKPEWLPSASTNPNPGTTLFPPQQTRPRPCTAARTEPLSPPPPPSAVVVEPPESAHETTNTASTASRAVSFLDAFISPPYVSDGPAASLGRRARGSTLIGGN